MPFKLSLSRKGGNRKDKQSTVSTVPSSPPATPASSSHLEQLPQKLPEPEQLREKLWNQAYDELKADEPSLLKAYEKILSHKLHYEEAAQTDLELQENEIEQAREKRWVQMKRLIQAGLKKTEKQAAIIEHVDSGIKVVKSVKELIDKAVQAAPQAAVAWTGVCFVLEVLSGPLADSVTHRQGIAYIVSMMEWYWNLTDLLLDKNSAKGASAGLRDQLEKHVVDLYKKLLLYQVKSVCLFNQNLAVILLKNLLKLDDWDGSLKDVKEAEDNVRRDSEQYNTQAIILTLEDIHTGAKALEGTLGDIDNAIRDQTNRQEKRYQTEDDRKCRSDLFVTDPRDDKGRIEDAKGGLLRDSYQWILENSDFRKWLPDPDSRLLWIKGDPGKGKTMLLCGIINELRLPSDCGLSYFFCEATNPRISNATAVLRGLIWLLVQKNPALISHVRQRYDDAGEAIFQDANAWIAMSNIFMDILKDPALKTTYLVIDALDECVDDLPRLLKFIVESASLHGVKWIVSSRNWPNIEEVLDSTDRKVRVCLELNERSISAAVATYIRHKVEDLTRLKKYDDRTRDAVEEYLSSHANDTFLWVALVCKGLSKPKVYNYNMMDILKRFPQGLDELYGRMLDNITEEMDPEVYTQVLALVSVVYRPLTLAELSFLIPGSKYNANHCEHIVVSCGSFLNLREGVIYFVHQSAQDFLLNQASTRIFPQGIDHEHHMIASTSLDILSKELRRDIYGLVAPGFRIYNVSPPDPDPLAPLRYLCVFWVDHLCASLSSTTATHGGDLEDAGAVHTFLKKEFLHWLESLSLLRSMPEGVTAIRRLRALEHEMGPKLTEFVQDAQRFALSNRWIIEQTPLQTYASALVFSPVGSVVRRLFSAEEPDWITRKPDIGTDWDSCLQTLEGHYQGVCSVAISPDGKHLASGLANGSIKIWNMTSGACIRTLQGLRDDVLSLAFSPNGAHLGAASQSKVQIWDLASSACIRAFEADAIRNRSVALSPDGTQFACGRRDNTVVLRSTSSGDCLRTLESHSREIPAVAYSRDGKQLATGRDDTIVETWDTMSGKRILSLEGHDREITSLAFSPDGRHLASISSDRKAKVWDAKSGECTKTLSSNAYSFYAAAYTPDGRYLALSRSTGDIEIWDLVSDEHLQTLRGHKYRATCLAFSADGKQLVSGSEDCTIKIWDTALHGSPEFQGPVPVLKIFVSPRATHITILFEDGGIEVWDIASGRCTQVLLECAEHVRHATVSPSSGQIAVATSSGNIHICNLISGAHARTLVSEVSDNVSREIMVFSSDGKQLAFKCDEGIRIWDTTVGVCTHTLRWEGEHFDTYATALAFSPEGRQISTGWESGALDVWDMVSGECTQLCDVRNRDDFKSRVSSVAFSSDGAKLLSGDSFGIIRIWEIATATRTDTVSVDLREVEVLAFEGNCLLLECGRLRIPVFVLDSTEGHGTRDQAKRVHSPQWVGYCFSGDASWITYDGQDLLWLPPQYRPRRSAVLGHTLGIVCSSGQVLNIEFSPKPFN